MKRLLLSGWTTLVVGAIIALAAVSFFAPGRRHIALDVFVLYLGGLGLAAGVRATRAASPDVHEPSLAAELADPLDVLPERPSDLERMERDVYLSCGTSFYLHHRLRPILREIAANRLLTRHGIDLDGEAGRRRGAPRRGGVVDAATRRRGAEGPLGAGAAAARASRGRRRA